VTDPTVNGTALRTDVPEGAPFLWALGNTSGWPAAPVGGTSASAFEEK